VFGGFNMAGTRLEHRMGIGSTIREALMRWQAFSCKPLSVQVSFRTPDRCRADGLVQGGRMNGGTVVASECIAPDP
jgi:hypothetical protein